MAILGDALRQAFTPRNEYDALREEKRAWRCFRLPALVLAVASVAASVVSAAFVSLRIVFPREGHRRPFCREGSLTGGDGLMHKGAFYLTEEEAANYYWMVVFIPSAVIFLTSAAYLVAGMSVAYSASTQHICLKVVENTCCASRRGSVRCLWILNLVFAVVFGLLSLFLGSSLLMLGSSCSIPLFWCYEIASWGLVVLYGGTSFYLRRKAAVAIDETDTTHHGFGLEMFETSIQITPEMERRINEGFRAWMGSPLLSSDDDDDGPDDYLEVVERVPSYPLQ